MTRIRSLLDEEAHILGEEIPAKQRAAGFTPIAKPDPKSDFKRIRHLPEES